MADASLVLLQQHQPFRWYWSGQTVSSTYRQVMYGSIPIGSALAGVIGEAAGTQAGVATGAAGMALSALPMLARRIRTITSPGRDLKSSASAA
jgi:hypothetical protein